MDAKRERQIIIILEIPRSFDEVKRVGSKEEAKEAKIKK